jgi:hypothetical protein
MSAEERVSGVHTSAAYRMKDIVSNYTMNASCYMYPFNRPTIFIILASVNTIYVFISLSLFPVAPTLEHRASVNRFVSLQFLNPKTVGGSPWTWDQPIARPLPIQIQNKHRQTSMPWVGFEPTIPPFERAKNVHASDRAATVTCYVLI